VVDGEFHFAHPRMKIGPATAGSMGEFPQEYTSAVVRDTAKRISRIL
jgi:hypothetical protein